MDEISVDEFAFEKWIPASDEFCAVPRNDSNQRTIQDLTSQGKTKTETYPIESALSKHLNLKYVQSYQGRSK